LAKVNFGKYSFSTSRDNLLTPREQRQMTTTTITATAATEIETETQVETIICICKLIFLHGINSLYVLFFLYLY